MNLSASEEAETFTSQYFFASLMLESVNSDMLIAINQAIPDFNDRMKKRYKEAKRIGKDLLKNTPGLKVQEEKVKPNDPCSCGSGKKYKKCCALMLN